MEWSLGRTSRLAWSFEELRGLGDPVALDERPAGRERPWAAVKVYAHRSPDQDPVGAAEERPDDRQLVRDLGAAEDRHERAGRVPERQAERLEFRLEKGAGRGAWKAAGAGVDRGVRPVCGPEGVVHVLVAVGGEVRRELGRVPGFSRVEAEVLEQDDLARPEFGRPAVRMPHRPVASKPTASPRSC